MLLLSTFVTKARSEKGGFSTNFADQRR